jgi:hypothetical protein
MGASAYAAFLGPAAKRPSTHARLEVPGSPQPFFRCPAVYQPWSCDGNSLLLDTWQAGTQVLRLEGPGLDKVPIRSTLHAGLCSPRLPVAFLLWYAAVDNATFVSLPDVRARTPRFTLPAALSYAAWLEDGRELLALTQDPTSPPALSVFEPGQTRPSATAPAEPAAVLGRYDEGLSRLKRDQYCLLTGEGEALVGYLLDRWNKVHFAAGRRTLFASVYRPTGAPFRESGRWVCRVREVWAEMTVTLQA